MGCDSEMNVGANTVYCILIKGHEGKCVWSKLDDKWSYHGKFDMKVEQK